MTKEQTDAVVMLLFILVLGAILWIFLTNTAEAQGGQYWYFTTHYHWVRTRRVIYPVLCSGYICKPACHTYYGGWRPCR